MRFALFALLGLLELAAFAAPAHAANITSNATGNWNATGTWVGGVVPTASDNVTIADGHTVTINATAACLSLTVGQGVSGILQFESATARTLTVGGDVTLAAGGTFRSATTGTVTTHVLSLSGSLTNNGTLDFSTNANTAAAGITFTGATSNSFSGSGGTTDVRALTISKGASANVLELMPSSFTVRGVTTDVAGFLTLTSGTFKVSGTFTMTNRVFTGTSITIPATGGLWLNNPSFTIPGQNGTTTNNGLFRITQGTMTCGTVSGNLINAAAGATFIFEGGTLNIASRFVTANAITFTQSGGTVNVNTVANTANNVPCLDLSSASNTVTLSGGTIALVQTHSASSASNRRDYNLNANPATVSITGGTLQVGTAATVTNFTFNIAGYMSNLVVDNTTNTKTAQLYSGSTASRAITGTINTGSTLNLNGLTLTITGSTFTNNGTLSGTTAGSTLAFLSESLAQTYTGTGGSSSPVDGITVDSPSGLTLGNTTNVLTLNARLLRGTIANSNKLTLGTGASAAVQAVFGKNGLATAGGSFDVAPTFNLGTGAYTVSYQPEGGGRTTGVEIPLGRSIANLIVNNANGVTLSGGDLSVSGTLTLTSGNVTTGASTLALGAAGTVSRTTGHIVGNLQKNVATGAAVSRTFEIGTGASYTPATVVFTTVSTAGNLTATTTAGEHPDLAGSSIDPTRSVNRWWTLTNGGVAFTDYGITLNFVAGDVDGGANTAAFQVRKYNAPNWTAATTGTRTSTSTQATGFTSFSDFAVGVITHTIAAAAGANGSISPSGAVVVDDGASQLFTFTPDACHRVADVLVDGVSVGTPTSYTFTNVTTDHTISVSFVNNFPITASAGAHGSIAPSGTTFVTCGADQTYTITPDVDYIVADVLVDGVSVGAVTTYTFTNVTTPHTIAASFVIENNPPVLSNVPAAATFPELAEYTFTATATDVETPDSLRFSLVGAPAGASIDSLSGVFMWTPSETQGPGVYPFTVRVFDGRWYAEAPITITVTEVSTAPAISGVPASATIPEMVATSFTASATDSDLPAQTLTFSLVGAPSGASIDPATGVFAWTPSEAQGPGTYPFAVRVSDGATSTDAAITLEVTEVNRPPVLSGVPTAVTVPELAEYTFTAVAADPDIPTQSLTFSLVGAPTGAAIDPGTGAFSWTPALDQTGVNAFAVRVTDGVVDTDSTITITVGVSTIADLVATPIKTGNDASGRSRIQLDWSGVASGRTVEVFRAGFGGYPLYDGAGGAVPAIPSYPPGAPWALTAVTTSGTTDVPPTRDFYYYVAFVHAPNSTVSPASNRSGGTLGYFLGDVSDGATPGQGDNAVNTTDFSLLGAHYGIDGVQAAAYPYLDVGPTTDFSADALPVTDGSIDFEDLIVFAINMDAVSAPARVARSRPLAAGPRPPVLAASGNALALDAGAAVKVGEMLDCPIALSATGQVKGLSVRLSWDPAKVRPSRVTPGEKIAEAGGVVLSPRPGVVDAAFMGSGAFAGDAVLATVSFVTLAAGDPGIKIETVDARDATNGKLVLPVEVHTPASVIPRTTALGLASPNPFSHSAAIAFDLSQRGRVQLEVYSVDGRRVRTLVDGMHEPGQFSVAWDGRDAGGRHVAAGLYYVRFVAGSCRFTRQVVFLR